MVDLTREFAARAKAESCGQCFPCRMGTERMADILDRICAGRGIEADLIELESLAHYVADGARCDIGQSATAESDPRRAGALRRRLPRGGGGRRAAAAGTYVSMVTAPCINACPTHVDIPGYVDRIRADRWDTALSLVRETCCLPGTIGQPRPFHFIQKRCDAIAVATNHLATLLETVRNDKEIIRLKDRLKPSEEAKRIVEELFFRRGIGANLELREAVEFERVRRFFDADSIKLVFRDGDGEYRIKASSGGAETGLMLDKRKLTGISRAVSEKKLLLLTSPLSSPAGNGYDSMPRQTLFIPVPYPDRDDLVLLLESETAALEFSEAKLSAVRVASVYLADLHFLFLAKRDGDRFRTSAAQLDDSIGRILHATSRSQMAAALGEACATVLPAAKGRLVILAAADDDDDLLIADAAGLTIANEMDWIRYNRFLKAMQDILLATGEGEKRIERSVMADVAPADLRERFDKYFAHLPSVMVQSVMPTRIW